MKRPITRGAVAAAALTTALVLGGCGSSNATSGSDASSSSAASASSSSAAPAAVKVGDTVDGKEFTTKVTEAMKKAGSVKMSMSASGMTMKGQMRTSPVAYSMTMDAQGQAIDMVYVDKALYMGGKAMAQATGGKQWIKVDPNGTDPFSKAMAPSLQQMDQAADPSQLLKGLDGVELKVVKVEGDTVTYRESLTAEQVQKMVREKSTATPAPTASVGPMTMDFTTDKDGLPQTVTTSISGMNVTMQYTDWGKPVTIVAPPAGQVGTFKMGG